MSLKIPLIDLYIIKQLILPWIFSLAVCTILGELIGISFEQIRFVTEREFPIITSLQVHLFKLPAFLSLALPFSLLMATIITYGQLSKNNEIIALKSFGINSMRLVIPALILSFIVAIFMFWLDAIIVPNANYHAAEIIENEFNIDRSKLAKYQKKNIIYQEFSSSKEQKKLSFLVTIDRFKPFQAQGIDLLYFSEGRLYKVITASNAIYDSSKQVWDLIKGNQYIISINGDYEQVSYFNEFSVSLNKNLLDYINNYRDNREMSIFDLYHRLKVIQGTNNNKKIRKLKVNIQERYAFPFSCIVFALLGTVLGCEFSGKTQTNSFTLTVVIIFIYQLVQFISTSFGTAGIISCGIAVWLPNFICLLLLMSYIVLPKNIGIFHYWNLDKQQSDS